MKHGISDLIRLLQRLALLGLALVISLSVGCGKGDQTGADSDQPKFEVADNSGSGTAPKDGGAIADSTVSQAAAPAPSMDPAGSGQPPSITSDQLNLNSTEVPDGTPEELLAFIEKLDAQFMAVQRQGRPPVGGEAAMMARVRSIFEAKLAAADKIMASAGTDASTRKKAIEAKLGALSILPQVDPGPSWGEKIRAFATLLVADEDADISRQGRTIVFGLRIGDIAQNKDSDYTGFISDLKTLLSDEGRNQEVLDVAQQATMALRSIGRNDESQEAFAAVAEAFKDHSDPKLAAESKNMFAQLELDKLDIDSKLTEMIQKKPGSEEALIEAIKTVIQGPDASPVVLQKSIGWIEMLEQTGNYQVAIQVCEMVKAAFANSSDDRLKSFATERTAAVTRRLNLVGKPLVVEGTKLDGSAFDFAKYKGKVVLVDFWATWCGPCVAELPNIRENYTKYHDKGFDVIGMNLDQSPQTALGFLANQKLPWDNVVGQKLAEKCGVEAIPFVVLLNQDGIVVDLHVRGAALGEKLAELLGPVAANTDAEPVVPLTPPE